MGRGWGWAGWLLLFVRVCLGNVVHHADLCFSVGSPLCLRREEASEGGRGDLTCCFLPWSHAAQTNHGEATIDGAKSHYKLTQMHTYDIIQVPFFRKVSF